MPAQWFLYECADCGQRTFLSPAGGSLNECACEKPSDTLVTPLYEDGPGKLKPRSSMNALGGGFVA